VTDEQNNKHREFFPHLEHYHDMNTTKCSILFFLVLCTCAANLCSQVSCASKPGDTIVTKLPQWITTEKIRAGFLLATDDAKYAPLIKTHGLNTVIVTATLRKKEQFKGTFENYRKWSRAGKSEKLHVFISYFWQPDPKSPFFRRVVYSDGSTGIAPCPRDHEYWRNHLTYLGKIITEMSLESDLQVDGILLDCELYGPELGLKRHYGPHTCFCDNCFSSFLLTKDYRGMQLPRIEYGGRKKWLKENGFLEDYFRFLEKDVESLASTFEQELHKVNPLFLLAIYPTPKTWVLKSMARGFGTKTMPMVIFGTDTYKPTETSRIPAYPQQFYAKQKINAVYAAGFLLTHYGADTLKQELFSAGKKCSGYWLFRMHMLWKPPYGSYKLADGSPNKYWQKIQKANDNIDIFAGKTITKKE
jgi:hypothetical protein